MRIVNKTAWRTEDLRRFAEAVAKERSFWPPGVLFLPSRHSVRGLAFVGTRTWWKVGADRVTIKMWLPAPGSRYVEGTGPNDIRARLWRTLLHEIDHNRGLDHKDMVSSSTYPIDKALAIELRPQEAPAPVPRTERTRMLVAGREQAARARLADWERRLKAAQRKVREYRGKVRGYERRAAAKAAASPERGN